MTRQERQIQIAEETALRMRVAERRWRDRFGRWFERAMLLVLAGLYLAGFHTQSQTDAKIDRESTRTTTALCVFRHDLEERAASGREFLRNHPHGFAGLSAGAIRVSLMGQERTIAALAALRCDE